MTKSLASRVAGMKLGGIVAVLLIPMLVLSYFMVRSLRQDIAFTERELDGITFNRIIQPVMMDAAIGKVEGSKIERLRGEGVALAARLGLERQMATALATFYTVGDDKRYVVRPFYQLLARSATSANVILDPFAETYHLGSVFSLNAPRLLADYADTSTAQSRALRDKVVTGSEMTAILLSIGSWKATQEHIADALDAAQNSSGTPESYALLAEPVSELAEHQDAASRIFSRNSMEQLAGALAAAEEFSGLSGHIVGDIDRMWSDTATKFEALLTSRLDMMRFRLGLMLAIAAAACLVGVGSAAILFRSTLKQLDTVELARNQAERARAEAESSAHELQRVSDDVIRLNRDLSDNLKKLRDAQDEALRKGRLSQLGQLTATVAHELRNPLGAVRTSAFLLERKVKDKGLGVEQQLQRIGNGITRCDNIITQLLDFARTKALNTEVTDLDAWLEQILVEEAQKLPEIVNVSFEPGLAGQAVAFDPARLTRVIINLVSNASEAMVGNGSDPSKFATPNPLITIKTAVSSRGVEIKVLDNGPGMNDDVLRKVLEPLYTTKSFGTGLGLPAVEKILQEHGGGIDIESSPGSGAMFTAWFPLRTVNSEAA